MKKAIKTQCAGEQEIKIPFNLKMQEEMASKRYGEPDYYVVDNDDFGSVPFTSISEVRDFILQSELVNK